jgi:hypothetical protein
MPNSDCPLLESGQLQPVRSLALRLSGRRPSPATVWRWTTKGTRNGILPTVRLYGAPHTTETAFRAWLRGEFAPINPADIDASDEALRAAGLL